MRKSLQKEILDATKKVISRKSFLLTLIHTLISTIIIVIVIYLLYKEIDIYTLGLAFVISLFYTSLRGIFQSAYSKSTMNNFYDYLKETKPGLELYIPIFQETRQGTLIKKSVLYVDKGKLYFEAFSRIQKKRPIKSVAVRKGKDFTIDIVNVNPKTNIVDVNARLNNGGISFSFINHPEVVRLVKK